MITFPLNKLREGLHEIDTEYPYINSGGCGFFAYALGSRLSNWGKIEIAIAESVLGEPLMPLRMAFEDALSNNDSISARYMNYNYDIGFPHVWVEFTIEDKIYSIDVAQIQEGTGLSGWAAPLPDRLPLDYIKSIVYNEEGWNCWFDRDDIPAIEKRLDALFNTL